MAGVAPLSHSQVQTYLECPLRWKFLYVDRRPEAPRGYFSFGRTVHSVLEDLLKPYVIPTERLAPTGERQRTLDDWGSRGDGEPRLLTPRELLALYERRWVSEGYNSRDEEERYRTLGADLLLRYRDQLVAQPPTPVAVEAHLQAEWEGVPVHGYLDRIDRTPSGGLEIVDYKTSRELSEDDARASDQLALYQVLVEKNFSEPVEGLTLYHLRSLRAFRSPPRGPTDLERLQERVGAASDGIRAQAYEPTPGRQCTRCEFKPLCPEFREVPLADQERLAGLVDRFAKLHAEEDRLEGELEAAAEALHQEAERLGVHRIAGHSATVFRRREEHWQYDSGAVAPILAEHGLEDRVDAGDPKQVRRLLRDTRIHETIRARVSTTGGRSVRWYWLVEDENGRA